MLIKKARNKNVANGRHGDRFFLHTQSRVKRVTFNKLI
jgi:hypothetical protein